MMRGVIGFGGFWECEVVWVGCSFSMSCNTCNCAVQERTMAFLIQHDGQTILLLQATLTC
jgi:hypothetical protein